MKNQYVCDIGDFGKYALLRVFAEAGIKIGVVKRKDGVEITIEKRADGRIQTKSSAEPNTTRIMDVEWFCNRIGY